MRMMRPNLNTYRVVQNRFFHMPDPGLRLRVPRSTRRLTMDWTVDLDNPSFLAISPNDILERQCPSTRASRAARSSRVILGAMKSTVQAQKLVWLVWQQLEHAHKQL